MGDKKLFAIVNIILFLTSVINSQDPEPTNGSGEHPADLNSRVLMTTTATSGKPCDTPSGAYGICTSLKDCVGLRSAVIAKGDDIEFMHYLQGLREICGKTQSNICCSFKHTIATSLETDHPSMTPELASRAGHLLTPEEGCGISKALSTRIVGGIPAKNGAFPWMAILAYIKDYGLASFECGGSLITSRHVLTAAHCILPELGFVRLGEHDLTTVMDGMHQDIGVLKAIRHHNYYDPLMTHDIGLVYLRRDVEFSDRIRPICLPLSFSLQIKSHVDENPFIAGWGTMRENGPPSEVLMQVQVPIIENSKCEHLFRMRPEKFEFSRYQFSDRVLCAGYFNGGQDACQGDSGGPMMLPIKVNGTFPMYQIGVVSYGIGCGDRFTPGVYTSVSHYMNWIQHSIHPDAN